MGDSAWAVLTAIIFCIGISGCVSTQPPAGSFSISVPGSQVTAPPLPSVISYSGAGVQPSVFIITPPFDGGILTGNVTIFVEVTDFALVPPGGKNIPGTGHLIYYRDTVPPAMEGIPAITRPGTYGVSSETMFRWDGITPGTHTFAVQLVNADNTPLDPPIMDAIEVTAVLPEMITN